MQAEDERRDADLPQTAEVGLPQVRQGPNAETETGRRVNGGCPVNLHIITLLLALTLLARCVSAADDSAHRYFTITVLDDQTGRGVPLVELTTTNHIRHCTDSNGIVAFYEQALMGTDVYFHVKSHGYTYPKDRFGYSGVSLKPVGGGSAVIRVKRENIAERIYRVTGEGIYADSLLVGRPAPIRNPVINGLVMGQDSVLSAVYKGKVYWFWGDTNRAAYPLGNFHTSGATSLLAGKGGLDPEVGVDLTYFVNAEGFSKEMMPFDAPGPVWLGGLVTLKDGDRGERLFAMYSNVDNHMKAQEIGLAEFDDKDQLFRKIAQFPLDTPIKPGGHPFKVIENGIEYVYFSPVTRVRADVTHLKDPSTYESFTCLREGSRKDKIEVDRDAGGKARFAWKRDTAEMLPQSEASAVKEGKLKSDETLFHIQDAVTGKPVIYHGASISWNEYRKRWVMIMQEAFGTSFLGETWYLEADSPLGPWVYARKIVTHDNYSFYNPRHHPMFDKEDGRVIFFEGTYTSGFTSNPNPTPRYDYNQIMYKLDLSDPRLALPVPIYAGSQDAGSRFSSRTSKDARIAFFAPDLPGVDTVPVFQENGRLRVGSKGDPGTPAFYALPADTADPPPTTTPLYEFVNGKRRAYTTDTAWTKPGFRRLEQPVCLVWKNPMSVRLPLLGVGG